MVVHLSLRGEPGKRGLMFVSYYGRSRAFIANYRSWKVYHSDGNIAEIASSLISHETLHLALNRFSLSASADLDNMFGRSNSGFTSTGLEIWTELLLILLVQIKTLPRN